ncbi:CoA ester lyase [Magnetovibrio sp.]|uniref:HpcH/HpaI aldolase/citrate lyase family protein n=1 Tax=Magnetovibrio sp. TaxID=2024836 RepID=UPI002F95F767
MPSTQSLQNQRPRRSVLYMPGSNARALEKGRTLACDALIMDLEDAVAPDAKEQARAEIVSALAAGGYGQRECIVRVNGLDTPWGYEDIAAAATSGADAILLPKVEGPTTIHQVERIMEAQGAPAHQSIWCMMETPLGILNAQDIGSASPRVGGLVMGTSDLAKDLRAAHTRERVPMQASLSHCLLVARAYGLAIVDGVHLDLDDDEGFAYSCEQGRDMGFDGKTLIHPKTIAKANEIFAPSTDEVAWSQKIIEAFEAAQSEGKGVVVVDGKLIENLHVEQARRLVHLADMIGKMETA